MPAPAITWPPQLKLTRHPKTGAWWIKGDGTLGSNVWTGPYETRAAAEDDRRGLLRYYEADGCREFYELDF